MVRLFLLFTLVFSLKAFTQEPNVRVFTPQDQVRVYTGKETDPRYFNDRDFKTIQATKEWVQQQATQEPSAKYYWRENPLKMEPILPQVQSSSEKSKSNYESGPIYQNETSRYDAKRPAVTFEEGKLVPEYDRYTGGIRYVPVTLAYVQRVANQDRTTNYFLQEKRVSSESNEMLRYSSGEPADKYLKDAYQKYQSEGYGTRYQMPPKAVMERDAQNAKNAAAQKNYENLYGKPLTTAPRR